MTQVEALIDTGMVERDGIEWDEYAAPGAMNRPAVFGE